MGNYIPNTNAEREEMLAAIGCGNVEELFAQIPPEVRLNGLLDIPAGLSEKEVRENVSALAEKNVVFKTIFRGAGAYRHFIPAAVKQIASKEEFVTAYTPYQAEISQGILQGIFEFQTMICALTGMDVANASVYDGAEAAAEAVAMCKERKRVRAFVSATANPQTIETVKTYCYAAGTPCEIIPAKDGVTDKAALATALGDDSACVYVEQPNFFGLLENAPALAETAHAAGAKFIMGVNPLAAAILKTPRECGADIAVGEAQPLGLSLAFGGPYLGFMSATAAMMRKLPGRIVGETKDADGKRAFVLTLQAREQHIRREKASSNICSNQAHCALTASVYMSAMGPRGLENAARQSMAKAHYMAELLSKIGYKLKFAGAFFHEFVTTTPVPAADVLATLQAKGILGGLAISDNEILWCATEENTKTEIDSVIEILK